MSIPERLTYRNCRNSVHGGGWGETRAQAGTCRWEKSFQAFENSGDLLDRALSVPYIWTMPTVAFSGGRDTRVERTSAFLLPPVSREFLRSHPRPFPTSYARIFQELGLGQAAGKTAEAKLGPASRRSAPERRASRTTAGTRRRAATGRKDGRSRLQEGFRVAQKNSSADRTSWRQGQVDCHRSCGRVAAVRHLYRAARRAGGGSAFWTIRPHRGAGAALCSPVPC